MHEPPLPPYFVRSADAPAFWAVGILWLPLATGVLTGNRFSLIDELCHGGSGPPTHTHEQDEGFYVLEGRATFQAGGQTIAATVGTFVAVPRRTPHSFGVDDEPSRVLNFYVPAGFELILMSLAGPAQSRTLPALDAVPLPPAEFVNQLSRDYGQKKIHGMPFVDRPTPENMRTEPAADSPARPFGASRADAPAFWQHGILWAVLASAEQTAGSYSVLEQLCPQGSGPGPHRHAQDEAFYVVEGEVTFQAGGQTFHADPGSFVYLPRGTVHAFRVDSPTARLLNFYTPGGFERTVVAFGEPAPARTLPPPGHPARVAPREELRALFAELGTESSDEPDQLRAGPGLRATQ